MKDLMIKDLQQGKEALFFAAVKSKDKKEKKNHESYLTLVLVDKTGEVEGKIWDDVPVLEPLFDVGDVVKVQGPVGEYRGKAQVTIKKLRKAFPDEVEPGDYLPTGARSGEEALAELLSLLMKGMDDRHLLWVSLEVVDRNWKSLMRSPAAMKVHHAYVGGLLEHIVSLVKLASAACDRYPWLNRDLMIAACLFHDIGKVRELSVELTFDYSTVGKLIGHVAIGLDMFKSLAREMPDFPEELMMLIEHIILSHHGQMQYGALKVPALPEAIAFHHLDALDAQMETARKMLEGVKPGSWSEWSRHMETQIYRAKYGLPVEEEQEEPPKTEEDGFELK